MVHVDLHRGDKDAGPTRPSRSCGARRRTTPAVLFVAAMLYRLDGLYEKALEAYDHVLLETTRRTW